jgi:hypothetical protein
MIWYFWNVKEIWQIGMLSVLLWPVTSLGGRAEAAHGYVGFDSNDYPGDAGMAELRKDFAFAGYWLTPAPLEKKNTWTGKRKVMEQQGYGFLLLARARTVNAIHSAAIGKQKGNLDAQTAAQTARAEGFASGAIIFLDLEDGGRLPAAYHAYLQSWADELLKQGFRPGVYCSGLIVDEGGGVRIVTADDIRTNEAPRKFAFWVFNDACPPSPGCVSVTEPPLPSASGVKDAVVWQFVRSPREKDTAAHCAGYAKDENCYSARDAAHKWNLDLNVAATANPSFAQ